MFRTILRIVFRNLWRSRGFTLINVFGFAIGISATLLISFYIQHELSFDRFHENYEDIYLVKEHVFWSGKWNNISQTSTPLGPAMKEDLAGVINTARVNRWFDMTIEVDGFKATEDRVVFTESSIFQVFSFPLIYGNPEGVLDRINTVALSRSLAEKYFGESNPIGKTIVAQDKNVLEVVAVFEDIPDNSTVKMNMAISYETLLGSNFLGANEMDNWRSFNNETFAKLQPGIVPENIDAEFENLIRIRDGEDGWDNHRPYLFPISQYHLNNDYSRVNMLAAVALFIMLIASINFMNLSTSRSASRTREIGVRKVLGSSRKSLIFQFLFESVVLTGLAMVLSLLLVSLVIPWFSNVCGKELALSQFGNFSVPFMIAIVVVVGTLSGLYPAFYLSSFQPIKVIKGQIEKRNGKVVNLRKGLVILQFIISITLILSTLTILRQFSYLQNKGIGFNQENLIYLSFEGNSFKTKAESFKQAAEAHPGVISTSISSRIFGRISGGVWGIKKPGDDNMYAIYTVFSDDDILTTLDVELSWRNPEFLSKELSLNDGFFINEATQKALNLDLNKDDMLILEDVAEKPVLGVLKNFHVHSLYKETKPMILTSLRKTRNGSLNKYDCRFLLVRVQPQMTGEVIKHLEKVWHQHDPALAFDYRFVDEVVDRQYRAESRLASIIGGFAIVGIVVAILGLLGLSAYDTEQRTKEIGIRKVLGATTLQIVSQLSRDFSRPVIISLIVAFPIAWYTVNGYLKEFPYRVNFSIATYFVIAFIIFVLALCTVSWQTIKAANSDPAEILRNE